jgi:hypothetical protein
MSSDVVKTAWANAWNNGDFICVETSSGYRSCVTDPKGSQHLLSHEVEDLELGAALIDALARSRFVTPQEDLSLFDYKQVMQRHSEWTLKLVAKYGYKGPRALFKEMMHCRVERRNGLIAFIPMCHSRLQEWSGHGITVEDHVIVPETSTPAQLGAALKLAFEGCT